MNLWHTEPALWDSSLLINSNADARKAVLSRISKEMLEGPRRAQVCDHVRFQVYYLVIHEY